MSNARDETREVTVRERREAFERAFFSESTGERGAEAPRARGDDGTRRRASGRRLDREMSALYELSDVKGRVSFILALWVSCASRVSPQIALAGCVGAAAQWLKLSKCDESLRYSTVCRYSFAIDAHLLVGFVISFLLVFRSLQAFRRYEEAKEALIAVKESLRNVVGTVETEGENAEGMREAMKRRRASMANGGYQDELRRLCNLAYAFMRQGLRESRFGVRAPHTGEIPDVSDDGLMNRDEDGTPSVSKLATEAERVQYAQIPVVSRPEAVMVNALSLVEIALAEGALGDRAAMQAFRQTQRALDAYRQAYLILDTPTPSQYQHTVTVLLFVFVFSLPFALTTLTDWRTPLVSATIAWLFYGVNEVASALEDPFRWSLPAHPLNVIGRRISREMEAFRATFEASGDDDEPLMVDSKSHRSWRGHLWFITDCFIPWRETTLPLISRQIFLAAVVGICAQLLKLGVCGDDVTMSSQCLVTFDISAHRVLGIPLSFLLVTNIDWGYERFINSKQYVVDLQNELRSVIMCASIFMQPKTKNSTVVDVEADVLELQRLSKLLFGFMRICVRELMIGGPDRPEMDLVDCLSSDEFGGVCKLNDLLDDAEIKELCSMPTHALTTWAAMRMNVIIDSYMRTGALSERFAAEAYRSLSSTLQAVQGLNRVATTPVPKQFRHLLQLLLFAFVFSTPFVLSVSYKWIGSLPAMLIALGFYGIAETSTGMMEPFSWSSPHHELSAICAAMDSRHERIGSLAFAFRGHHDSWVKLVDEMESKEHIHRSASRVKEMKKRVQRLFSRSAVHLKKRAAFEKDFKKMARRSALALRSGWSFVSCIFHVHETVLPPLIVQIVLSAAIAVVANAVKIHWCGDDVTMANECALTFDSGPHVTAGSILGFTLVFRLSLSYMRYYDGKGMVGKAVNAIRCLNFGAYTMIHPPESDASVAVKQSISEDVIEIRRLSIIMLGFMRQAIRERRHGVEPYALKKMKPTPEELMQDPRGWPSLSVMLTDDEKIMYAKCDYRTRIGVCGSKIMRIIDKRRRLGHVSDRCAFEMLGRIDVCMEAMGHIERAISSVMPFAFLHLMNFVLFFFAMSAPFVFITSYKWLAPLPSMLVTASLFGIAEMGSLLDDPFGWEHPRHDLTATGWMLYMETTSIHETVAQISGETDESTHSGVDSLILSGGAAPKALEPLTVWEMLRRHRGVSTSVSYFSYLTCIRGTVFSWIWPMMSLMVFLGVIVQFYKLWVCGSGATNHRQCDMFFAPDAVDIVGRLSLYVVVYRFFFAFRVFYEAKTGIFDVVYGIHLLNVHACTHLLESPSGKQTSEKARDHVRRVRIKLLRLTHALYQAIKRDLRRQHAPFTHNKVPSWTSSLAERDESTLGLLLDFEKAGMKRSLLDMRSDERVAGIASRVLYQIETAREEGYVCNRGASMMVNCTRDVLHAYSRCARTAKAKTPYKLNHMVNALTFIWLCSTASVLVMQFKYATWLPLGILSSTLYGLLAIASRLEMPFRMKGSCSNDLEEMGDALWSSCASTQATLAESDALRDEIDAIVGSVKTARRLSEDAAEREEARARVADAAPDNQRDDDTTVDWNFPKQRIFKGDKFGVFLEFFSFHGTVVFATLPYMLFAGVVATGWYYVCDYMCSRDALYQSGTCKILISPEAHTLSVPVLGFCIAYVLNLTYMRFYAARQYLDDVLDHARDVVLELHVAFTSSRHTKTTDAEKLQHARMSRTLNVLVAFIRHSVRESLQGYPPGFDKEEASTPNTILDDDFFGSPSTRDLLRPEERNQYANIAPAFRVAKCSGELKRSMIHLPKRGEYEQRLFRVYRSIDGIMDAWTNCETIVNTPIPPFYMYSVYLLCFVFVMTSPLAFINSYGRAVAVPVGILAFVFSGIVQVSNEMMIPFKWNAMSHNINEITKNVYRLTKSLAGDASPAQSR